MRGFYLEWKIQISGFRLFQFEFSERQQLRHEILAFISYSLNVLKFKLLLPTAVDCNGRNTRTITFLLMLQSSFSVTKLNAL